ncbi:hypothetical protein [Pantoea phage LIMEzero]|uniref:TtsA-like Glycoside hydrolase family 108 domain-containing protein n=1 Tax=Pantoea phage LIMEzero TaxID=943335 RepID=F4N9V8_9CAUD|nr:endolysin [Pantoea phage LIMEzero]CBY88586.1 hypothetical protein [Pantoea phage LIMEzero]
MSNFDTCMKFTGLAEGGYTNLPGDPGGETNYGISDNRDGVRDGMVSGVPGAPGPVPVKQLTHDQALAIYRRDYYAPIRGDALPLPVAVAVFDYAVNSGVGTAAKALQRACSVTVDGKIGPATVAQAKSLNARSLAQSVCNLRVQMLEQSTAPGVVKYRAALIARAKRCAAFAQTL